MPLYEYRCLSCGERIEVLQHVGDPPLTRCNRCEGQLEKVISAPALQFKGSGWYVTDYAKTGKAGTGAARASESAEGGSGSKAESKPAESKAAESKPPKTGTGS